LALLFFGIVRSRIGENAFATVQASQKEYEKTAVCQAPSGGL
jgi:hypothetical protein